LAQCGDTLPVVEIPERIEVRSGDYLEITWPDGATAVLTAAGLRASCPCATCGEPETAARLAATVAGREWKIAEATLVGDYALGLTFEPDGHSTGIYTYAVLAGLSGRGPAA
jgi:DUF971 family protein